MELKTGIQKFIEHPFQPWEGDLTRQLVQNKWRELESTGFHKRRDYSTARIWLRDPSGAWCKTIPLSQNALCLEMPSADLQTFYDEHGLELLSEAEIEADAATVKLKAALSTLQSVKGAYECVADLVQSLHVLRQPDPEIDLSYSHPHIPFSIFVSLCKDDSELSNLRVAESILHEAMHLKLTLIEGIVPLVKPDTDAVFYSPWKEEERPVKGVLHGLFVFRAIKNFYRLLHIEDLALFAHRNDFVKYRLEAIQNELLLLAEFPKSEGLTNLGKELAKKLLM